MRCSDESERSLRGDRAIRRFRGYESTDAQHAGPGAVRRRAPGGRVASRRASTASWRWPRRRSTSRPAGRSPTSAPFERPHGEARGHGRRRASAPGRGCTRCRCHRRTLNAARPRDGRASPQPSATRPAATTPPRTCCMRRCARCSAPHVKQAGLARGARSPALRLRPLHAVTREQLLEIEQIVNEQVLKNTPVQTEVKDTQEAIAAGAMALFGEKYGDKVRVVSIPGFSHGAVRRHARARHRRHRPVRDRLGERRRRRRATHRSDHRPRVAEGLPARSRRVGAGWRRAQRAARRARQPHRGTAGREQEARRASCSRRG